MLVSEPHAILKQAVGSTRKAQSDLSYEVNDDFEPAPNQTGLPVIVLPEALAEAGPEEAGPHALITDVKKVSESVNVDRRYHIESVIIKVMKRLKLCSYEAMMDEVVPLLKFGQQWADAEPRVEVLAKRGNLELFEETAEPADEQSMQVDTGCKAKTRMVKYLAE